MGSEEDKTNPNSKGGAQRRTDQIRSFQVELKLIEDERIISLDESQRTAIASYHEKLLSNLSELFDVDISKREKQLSLGMKIASFLGALGLAASIFFLFYQFWGRFSPEVQVCILIASPILGLAVTMIATRRERTGYFSKLFGMVALTCFVLNLYMLGQIFNITPSFNASWHGEFLLLSWLTHPIRACSWQRGLSVSPVLCRRWPGPGAGYTGFISGSVPRISFWRPP